MSEHACTQRHVHILCNATPEFKSGEEPGSSHHSGYTQKLWTNKVISIHDLHDGVADDPPVQIQESSTVDLGNMLKDTSDSKLIYIDDNGKTTFSSATFSELGDLGNFLETSNNLTIPKQSLVSLIGNAEGLLESTSDPVDSAPSAFSRDGYYPLYTLNTTIHDYLTLTFGAVESQKVKDALVAMGLSELDSFYSLKGESTNAADLIAKFKLYEVGPNAASGTVATKIDWTWTSVTNYEQSEGFASGKNYYWLVYDNGSSDVSTSFDSYYNDAAQTQKLATVDFFGSRSIVHDRSVNPVEKNIISEINSLGSQLNILNNTFGLTASGGDSINQKLTALGDTATKQNADSSNRTIMEMVGDIAVLQPNKTILGTIGNTDVLETEDKTNIVTAVNELHSDAIASIGTVALASGGSLRAAVNSLYDVIGSSSTNTYTIGVTAPVSGAYIMSGSDRLGAFFVQINPTITVSVGDILQFTVDATSHPFYIKDVNSTGDGNQVAGVTGQGAENDVVTFDTSTVTPGVYYYNCEYHDTMYGQITVGESVSDLKTLNTGTSVIDTLNTFDVIIGNETLDAGVGTSIISALNTLHQANENASAGLPEGQSIGDVMTSIGDVSDLAAGQTVSDVLQSIGDISTLPAGKTIGEIASAIGDVTAILPSTISSKLVEVSAAVEIAQTTATSALAQASTPSPPIDFTAVVPNHRWKLNGTLHDVCNPDDKSLWLYCIHKASSSEVSYADGTYLWSDDNSSTGQTGRGTDENVAAARFGTNGVKGKQFFYSYPNNLEHESASYDQGWGYPPGAVPPKSDTDRMNLRLPMDRISFGSVGMTISFFFMCQQNYYTSDPLLNHITHSLFGGQYNDVWLTHWLYPLDNGTGNTKLQLQWRLVSDGAEHNTMMDIWREGDGFWDNKSAFSSGFPHNWHHIVIVITANNLYVYLNGGKENGGVTTAAKADSERNLNADNRAPNSVAGNISMIKANHTSPVDTKYGSSSNYEGGWWIGTANDGPASEYSASGYSFADVCLWTQPLSDEEVYKHIQNVGYGPSAEKISY